jgi:hypothetical protein
MNKYRYPSIVMWSRIPNNRIGPSTNLRTDTSDANMETPAHGTYGGLLFDPRWKQKRTEILARDGGRCVICTETGDLQVHHRQYHFIKELQCFKVPWDYEDKLLITLCKSCHNRGHSKYKVPTLTI